ncbi:MAG: hypothetical protein HPY65_12435 [Syntrophaceae bacterium]|nr:hypothetical protein [Syntrophaceae bacterium]
MKNGKISQDGSALIVLIITMIIMGVLGTSMYLLTTTGTFGSLFANKANRALLLAESGIRYDQSALLADGTYTVNLNSGNDQFVINKSTDSGTGVKTTISTGIADASGVWAVRRKLTYVSSGSGGGSGTGAPTAVPTGTIAGGTGNSTGTFTLGNYYGNEGAVKVTGVKGDVDNPYSYPEAYGAPTWTTNPFCQAWLNSGKYLSYDVQLKLSEEHDRAPATWVLGQHYNYDAVVRDWGGNDLLCNDRNHGCTGGDYFSGWANVVYVFNLGGLFRMVGLNPQTTAYGLSFYRTSTLANDGTDEYMRPSTLGENEPAIMLFSRDGGANTGQQSRWLAYMPLSVNNFVVDDEDFLKRWNTLLARVIEAASIKLSASSAPNINVGDQVTGGTGSGTIIKKINDSDGRVVLLLNNVSGSFTSPVTVGGTNYSTYNGWGDAASVPAWQSGILYHVGDWVIYNNVTYQCILEHTSKNSNPGRIRPPNSTYWLQDTPPSFYRSRDNYIWAFYADTDNHQTYNATATDDTRREKDLFPNDLTNFTPPFPLIDVQAWDAANDDFTLVTWAYLNTSADSSLRRLGTGKELNAIIRTNKWTTGSYPTSCSSWSSEIGIVAKGTEAMQYAYDDLAYRVLFGAGSGGGTPSAGYYTY